MSSGPAIVVDQLVKRYGTVEAVRGISFEVLPGEVFGLLGPNGAGKTTTLEVLEGFRDCDGGSVRVLGFDPTTTAGLREIRRRVGVVLQQTGHYRFLTARETVQMHRGYHPDPRGVDEVLELVGLEDAADQRVRQMSGGQQRRLDVGVALVGRPEMIFLDEPTTGFDPAARRRAWEMIESLRDLGTTVLLTTHYMEEAQRLADRVAVMRLGRVAGVGTPGELARELRLASTLSFAMPPGICSEELPPLVRDAVVSDGFAVMECADPTSALAELCGWALDRGVRLESMELRAPSLEESYLTLTETSA